MQKYMSDFLPEEFKNRMKEILADEYDAFEKSYENERYRALRVNPLKRNINGKIIIMIYNLIK